MHQDHVIRAKRCQDADIPVILCIFHNNDLRPVRQRLFFFQQLPGKVARTRAAGTGVCENDQRLLAGFYLQRERVVIILHQRQRFFRDLPF